MRHLKKNSSEPCDCSQGTDVLRKSASAMYTHKKHCFKASSYCNLQIQIFGIVSDDSGHRQLPSLTNSSVTKYDTLWSGIIMDIHLF
jgi:hypothetical protein